MDSWIEKLFRLIYRRDEERPHNIWVETPFTALREKIENVFRRLVRPQSELPRSKRDDSIILRGPLYRLPEELLINIMENLDDVSLLCLRRTSRKFMRLFGNRSFKKYHGSDLTGPRQSEHKNAIKGRRDHRKFLAIIGRDRLCSDCHESSQGAENSKMAQYRAWSEELLHCSGCAVDHPSCAFSRTQRLMSPERRVCIGRQGFVRVCRHRIFTWAEIESLAFKDWQWHERGTNFLIFSCELGHVTCWINVYHYRDLCTIDSFAGHQTEYENNIEYDWDEDMPVPERDYGIDGSYSCGFLRDGKRTLVPLPYWYRCHLT
jgi:F-box domain